MVPFNGAILWHVCTRHKTVCQWLQKTYVYKTCNKLVLSYSWSSVCVSMYISSAVWANCLLSKASSNWRIFLTCSSDLPFIDKSVSRCFAPCTVTLYILHVSPRPSFLHEMNKNVTRKAEISVTHWQKLTSSSDTKCPSTCQLYFEISCYYEDKQTKYTIHHIHIQ